MESRLLWPAVTFVALLLLLWPIELGHLRAAILLDRLSGQRATRLQHLISGRTRTAAVEIPFAPGNLRGHLYQRVNGRMGPGIVIVHGLSPVGDEYDDLIKTAESLAASGFTVLTPSIPPLMHFRVVQDDVDMIGTSANWLAHLTGAPVTVLGISFGGGLVMDAAASPRYRSSFRQVVALSPYDDLERISRFYLTGIEPEPNGGNTPGLPANPLAIEITAFHFFNRLVPPEDAGPVRGAVEHGLLEQFDNAPLDAHFEDGLTPRQRTETQDFLLRTAAFRQRLAAALDQPNPDLDALSPHSQLASITVPVTVISGLNDPAIPVTESHWLQHDMPPSSACKIHFTPLIRHVSFAAPAPESPRQRLNRWFYKILLIHALAPSMQAADPHIIFNGCS